MPIIWRYLLSRYFQAFFLCISSFISILLVLRFQDIARFASSGSPKLQVVLFTLFQIPHILPIAIPVSSLIAALLLFQRLSLTNELTAFRTSGLSLKPIIQPIIFASLLLSLFNLTISCEISPRCRTLSKELIYNTVANNPLLLFQKEGLVKLKSAYVDIKRLQPDKFAEDILLAAKNTSNERLTLMLAKELSLKKELLKGKQVTFISSIDPKKGAGFDHLVIENQTTMDTEATNLSQLTQSADFGSSYANQTLRMILAKEVLKKKKDTTSLLGITATLEITYRLSLACAVFTFTLIGIAFGIHIGRNPSKKGLIWAIALSSLYMICFITAKSLRHSPNLSIWLYILPHPVILLLCLRPLKSIARGIE